jgi:hypothetical protein
MRHWILWTPPIPHSVERTLAVLNFLYRQLLQVETDLQALRGHLDALTGARGLGAAVFSAKLGQITKLIAECGELKFGTLKPLSAQEPTTTPPGSPEPHADKVAQQDPGRDELPGDLDAKLHADQELEKRLHGHDDGNAKAQKRKRKGSAG